MGSAKHRLWACPAYRETRFDLPPTHQHQGETATDEVLKRERGEMHDPVENGSPGRTHGGTIPVWVNQSVVGSSLGGKLFVDGFLFKHGAEGGQAGWAVAQIHEATHELVCSAHSAMPISLTVQRRIMRAELWALLQAVILSGAWPEVVLGACGGVAANLGTLFRDICEEAQIDSETKCNAHLSKSEQTKQDETGRTTVAGNEWADELAKEGARGDSFQTVRCDMYKAAVETSRAIISYIVVAPPREQVKKTSLARPHKLTREERQWCCNACGRHASDDAAKAKLARTECVGHTAATLGEQARPQCHLLTQTGTSVWCCRFGARASKFAKLGEPCVEQRGLQSMRGAHACCRAAGIPRKTVFLDRRSCSQRKHGQSGSKATNGTTATKLGWPNSSKQWIGSARQKRSQLIPLTRSPRIMGYPCSAEGSIRRAPFLSGVRHPALTKNGTTGTKTTEV